MYDFPPPGPSRIPDRPGSGPGRRSRGSSRHDDGGDLLGPDPVVEGGQFGFEDLPQLRQPLVQLPPQVAVPLGRARRGPGAVIRAEGLHRVFTVGDQLVNAVNGVDLRIGRGETSPSRKKLRVSTYLTVP